MLQTNQPPPDCIDADGPNETDQLTHNMLRVFFATHGEKSQQCFIDDAAFRQMMWQECLRTLGALAQFQIQDDAVEQEVGIAAEILTDVANEPEEVTALRLFVWRNFMPSQELARPGSIERMRLFIARYEQARGQDWSPPGH
jgi:hypothetical protein